MCSTKLSYAAPSLYDICVNFVSENITQVDSLCGFPELIGECLFKTVVKKGLLSTTSDCSVEILLKFTDAYGKLICNAFVQRASGIFVEHCIPAITKCFLSLVVLDLNGCKLGDDHDLLRTIAGLNCLEKLGLSNNCLSDVGIQKLTLPLRMFKKGPESLNSLDLSDNPKITSRVVRFFSCFTHLRNLDLSRTQLTDIGISELESKMNLQRLEGLNLTLAGKPCVLGNPTMEGWAADVLTNWMLQSEEASLNRSKMASNLRTSVSFYGSQRKKLEGIRNFQSSQEKDFEDAISQLSQTPLIFRHNDDEAITEVISANTTDMNTQLIPVGTSQTTKTTARQVKSGFKPPSTRVPFTEVMDLISNHELINSPTGKRKSTKNESCSKNKRHKTVVEENVLNSHNLHVGESASKQSQCSSGRSDASHVTSSEIRDLLAGYLTGDIKKSKANSSLFDALDSTVLNSRI